MSPGMELFHTMTKNKYSEKEKENLRLIEIHEKALQTN